MLGVSIVFLVMVYVTAGKVHASIGRGKPICKISCYINVPWLRKQHIYSPFISWFWGDILGQETRNLLYKLMDRHTDRPIDIHT